MRKRFKCKKQRISPTKLCPALRNIKKHPPGRSLIPISPQKCSLIYNRIFKGSRAWSLVPLCVARVRPVPDIPTVIKPIWRHHRQQCHPPDKNELIRISHVVTCQFWSRPPLVFSNTFSSGEDMRRRFKENIIYHRLINFHRGKE